MSSPATNSAKRRSKRPDLLRRSNVVRDAGLRDDQVAAIAELATRVDVPRSQIVRTLVDLGIYVLTGREP